MTEESKKLPHPVIRRLPKYLARVHELLHAEVEWVSSQELAEALNLTSSTVRQDLSYLDLTGISKRGYETSSLDAALNKELDSSSHHHIVIVGAGYLGCALAVHGSFAGHGFQTCGIFDIDPSIIGSRVGILKVQPMKNLQQIVDKFGVDIGIIAVPAAAAQEVADQLVAAGVKGLLNLAYASIQIPAGVSMLDARILASLQELAYMIKSKNEETADG
ncbi:MAG: redox-sensing transcriptional repressor Rex [Verrucomicrobia bacterium]|nr:redox-sensing transcriptional repressor Rex [Verrucomicrobiota bacterium]